MLPLLNYAVSGNSKIFTNRIRGRDISHHITSRGDRREDIYLDDTDRELWLEIFGGVCERFNWRCHAWCLMDNHYHVVVETIEGNLSKGMRQLNGVYTQAYNRRHNRVGHVYQGRFKGILVDKESYLLELSRYVVLNPLRAKMVQQLIHWRWSSYRSMIGRAVVPEWLETDWLLSHFGKQRKRAVERYVEFVKAGKGLESIWDDKKHPGILGDEVFIESVYKQYVDNGTAELKEFTRLERRPLGNSLRGYFSSNRSREEGMAAAYKSGNFTLQEIADYCDLHYSTVSRLVNSLHP